LTRDLNSDILAAIENDTVYPFIAVQMNLDTYTLRMWSGYGDKNINGVDFDGVGTLLGVSAIDETAELYASGATVSLSGVPSDMLSLALNQSYQGRRAYIYLGVVVTSSSWILSEGAWRDGGLWMDSQYWTETGIQASQIFSGYLDQMTIDEQSDTATIAVTIESKLIDLERVRAYNYTSATQKALYPGDLGLDFVESLQGRTYNWGRV
jgi:hypothetical protein